MNYKDRLGPIKQSYLPILNLHHVLSLNEVCDLTAQSLIEVSFEVPGYTPGLTGKEGFVFPTKQPLLAGWALGPTPESEEIGKRFRIAIEVRASLFRPPNVLYCRPSGRAVSRSRREAVRNDSSCR